VLDSLDLLFPPGDDLANLQLFLQLLLELDRADCTVFMLASAVSHIHPSLLHLIDCTVQVPALGISGIKEFWQRHAPEQVPEDLVPVSHHEISG
jgi:hypothetical protein